MPNPQDDIVAVSVVLCDDLFRDARTGKMVIVGTFHYVNAPALPAVQPHMALLITLTNGRGNYVISVAIEHERTGNEVFRVGGPMELENPLAMLDIDLRLANVVFPDDGKYWVVVREGERIVGQRPFVVRIITPEGGSA